MSKRSVKSSKSNEGSKKKGKAEKAEKRVVVLKKSFPELPDCPFVAYFTRAHTTESSGKLARSLMDFRSTLSNWQEEVREALSTGRNAVAFLAKHFPNPNIGLMSRSVHDKMIDSYNEVGSGILPPRYNPVLVDMVRTLKCISLRRGLVKNHPSPPKNWDEKVHGNWWHEWLEDGKKTKEPSGWFFDEVVPRSCHARRAEMLIDDPAKNILSFGKFRYVVGTGSHDGSAAFKIWQTDRGNYRAGDMTRKKMSLAGLDVRDIVFKIEDHPNNDGGFTVKGKWSDVIEMVYMLGQVLTAGHLHDSQGKVMTAKEIRAIDPNSKGLRFKELSEPIVGKAVHWSKMWDKIQEANRAAIKAMRKRGGRSEEYEAGSAQTKSITNICVNGKRVDPGEVTPFGLKGSQSHMPAYIVADGEGRVEDGHFSMGVVIGVRANAPYNVGVNAAKRLLEPEQEQESEEELSPKPTRSRRKAKSDEAPPIESDTVNEDEEECGLRLASVAEEV